MSDDDWAVISGSSRDVVNGQASAASNEDATGRGLVYVQSALVLERPEIPLHTNASKNNLRACVTKRRISGGTMSERGRLARDVMLGLMKTCQKLGISFFAYLGDRFGLKGLTGCIPFLPELVAVRTA